MNKPKFSGIIPRAGTSISLREGMRLQAGGNHLVLHTYSKGEILLQDIETGILRSTSDAALYEALWQGHVTCEDADRAKAQLVMGAEVVAGLESRGVTTKAIDHAVDLIKWLTACRQYGIDRFVDEAWVRAALNQIAAKELKGVRRFAISTLYEADLNLRKSDGDVCVLVPDYANRGGRGKWRADPRTIDLLSSIVQEGLKPPYQLAPHKVWQELTVQVNAANAATVPELEQISESTVRRYIEVTVPAFVRHQLKAGKASAAEAYRNNGGARETALRPLQVAEYDDIDACVFLIDERNGLPWGRSWITNGIDRCTRAPLGSYLGDKPRNYHSAIGTIVDSLIPKTWCQPGEMGYGVQGVMLVDNASYNVGKAMKHRSETERLLVARTRPFAPTEKATIEFFNFLIKSDFCPTLPGFAGPKGDRDALKEGMATAILAIAHFQRLYRHWKTKIYANTPGEDGFNSKQRWLNFYEKHSPAVRYRPEELALFRLRPITTKLRASGGIKPLRLRYDSSELTRLRQHIGNTASVVAFMDPLLPSSVKVLHPVTGQYFDVPCVEDHAYISTITLSQHRLIVAMQRSRGIQNPSLKDLVEGRRLLMQMVQEAKDSSKYFMRKWARQVDPFDDAEPADLQPKPQAEPLVLVTELEYQISELNSIEIDEEAW